MTQCIFRTNPKNVNGLSKYEALLTTRNQSIYQEFAIPNLGHIEVWPVNIMEMGDPPFLPPQPGIETFVFTSAAAVLNIQLQAFRLFVDYSVSHFVWLEQWISDN